MFVCVDDLTVYSENIGLEYTVKMWTIFRETLTACTLKFWLYGCAVKFATMYSEKLEMYSKTLCAVKSLSRYGEHWTVCSENFDWEGVMWNLRQSAMKFMTFDSKQCDCVSVCASKHITVDSGQFFFTRYSETWLRSNFVRVYPVKCMCDYVQSNIWLCRGNLSNM